ncbi:MAG: hypothetical protein LAN59_16565 [Acidobacteriia bacterium]|nr:hypothetical protein [Terriglobia bacterium]
MIETRTRGQHFLHLAEAREFVRSLGLKSQIEWRAYCASGKRPSNIPASPHSYYGNEWVGYGDWLGTEKLGNRTRQFLPFYEARDLVRSLGLKSHKDWIAYCHSGTKPTGIPIEPHRVYKEWVGYGDWLGTGKLGRNRKFLAFKQAREFARSLRLKSRREWGAFCRSGKKPEDVPALPNSIYKEWASYGDWLGTGNVSFQERSRNFRTFRAARAFARAPHNSPTEPTKRNGRVTAIFLETEISRSEIASFFPSTKPGNLCVRWGLSPRRSGKLMLPRKKDRKTFRWLRRMSIGESGLATQIGSAPWDSETYGRLVQLKLT